MSNEKRYRVLLREFIQEIKKEAGCPDALMACAAEVQGEALHYAVDGFIGLMDCGPPKDKDIEEAKRQIGSMMDAIAATNRCLYRDADH